MKFLLALPCALLVGCVAVPVTQHFPKAPEALQAPAPELKEVPQGATAADVVGVVIDNYGTYYEVVNQLQGWQQWYQEQKKIFESVQ